MSFFSCIRLAGVAVATALICASPSIAQSVESTEAAADNTPVRVVLDENGNLFGHVFTVLGDQQSPVVANVTLQAEGGAVLSSATDVVGKFSFADVKPGEYTMKGVSGEYVGNQVVVVAANEDTTAEAEAVSYSSMVPLQVAYDGGYVDSYAGGEIVGGCATCGGGDVVYSGAAPSFGGDCSTCGGGSSTCGGGFGGGGGIGGGGIAGGGSNLRRLALIGTAVAIPVALSGGNDASPVE